jgi:hypothetical protein
MKKNEKFFWQYCAVLSYDTRLLGIEETEVNRHAVCGEF